MNIVRVTEGREEEFEKTFANRRSYMAEVPGFRGFELLKRDEGNQYAVSTRWEDKDAFETWVGSDSFFAAHQKRDHTLTELVDMPTWEVIQVEEGSEK